MTTRKTGKAAITAESLTTLGTAKLARIVLAETETNAAFRKLVKAALAGAGGGDAVAKLVDRRLAGLEKAHAMVDWRKERAFADDIANLVRMIVGELADQDVRAAAERLLRFIATHQTVFERIDDSGGRIQGVYADAVEDCGRLFQRLPEDERSWLPATLAAMLQVDTHGLTGDLIALAASLLSPTDRAAFDRTLAGHHKATAQTPLPITGGGVAAKHSAQSDDEPGAFTGRVRASAILAARQSLADASGDVDLFIALENAKLPHMRDTHAIALRLHAAKRHADALKAIRTEGARSPDVPFEWLGRATSVGLKNPLPSLQRVRLEAEILTSLSDPSAAQSLRWQAFERLLDAGLLREHIAAAGDFAEFEITDRAFAAADRHADPYRALAFYIALPDLKRAAALVLARRNEWSGERYYELPQAAGVLEPDHPLAATILTRVLLTDILDRARSKAYGHAARYLARLDDLTASIGAWPAGIAPHREFRAAIESTHKRKAGFWAQFSA